MKKAFLELVRFDVKDIITTSLIPGENGDLGDGEIVIPGGPGNQKSTNIYG